MMNRKRAVSPAAAAFESARLRSTTNEGRPVWPLEGLAAGRSCRWKVLPLEGLAAGRSCRERLALKVLPVGKRRHICEAVSAVQHMQRFASFASAQALLAGGSPFSSTQYQPLGDSCAIPLKPT